MPIKRSKLLDRKINVRDATLFVIATEGEKTEKQYFSLFQSSRIKIEVVANSAENSRSAPEYVLERLEYFRQQYDLHPNDALWLMIDVDRWGAQKLSTICQQAVQKGFHLSVSNPCLELWLWLHHGDAYPSDSNGGLLEKRLRNYLGSYNKANLDVQAFVPFISDAITRAKVLDADVLPESRWPSFPGTHVYKVVEQIVETIGVGST